jgi:NAD(P)-dependent dehydrogenase (short-subunit alcohol dehydrogenase family)
VVVATARSVEAAAQTVREIEDLGTEAIYVQCDVTDEAQVGSLVTQTVAAFGSLDFAFNNAGVGADGVTLPFLPLTELPVTDWDIVSDTNFKAIFLCLKHELRQMRKQCSGVIVNTASTAGMRIHPDFGAYGPSKAGAIASAKLAALENKDKGIRVNVVAPGPIRDTGMSDRLLSCVRPGSEGGGMGESGTARREEPTSTPGFLRCLRSRSWACPRTSPGW